MTEIKGTNVSSSIVPFTTEDTFATHEAKYGKGGWREVDSIAERDAISAQRREAGMAVFVLDLNKVYILDDDLTTWRELQTGGGVDDVRVNTVSVVQNRVANITIEQPDWTETDSTKLNYILHKPTNVSDFTNDANYQNAQEVGSSITTAISEHNTASDAHSNILTPIKADITDIQALIPSAASTSNQLADKDFVNSTVATQTANFIGTFANVSELRAYSGTITNNDYAFVINQVVTDNGNDWATFAALDLYDKNLLTDYDYAWVIDGNKFDLYRFDIVEQEWSLKADNIDKDDVSLNRAFCRYKATVNGSTVTWNYEYTLNNSSFTAAQWAAINSGVTPAMVSDYLDPNSTSSTAYNTRISTLMLNKLSKTSTASRVYGTDSAGAQTLYQAGTNIEFGSDGKINVVGVQQQMFEMPEATADIVGNIVQYMGETTATYTHGVMYQCVPVYGNYTATYSGTGTLNNLQFDSAVFMRSSEFVDGQTRYVFTCMRAGLRQQWQTPSGMITSFMAEFGITYNGRAAVNDTITITASIVGYTWEAYAGVSSGNDKIDIVGDKIYGVNVVPQYTRNTLPAPTESNVGLICQYKGTGLLLDIYQDGYFYQVAEDVRMRSYSLEADPNKYSSLYVDNWFALEDFMQNEFDDVTFYYVTAAQSMSMQDGWLMRDSMLDTPTADLSQYGILYTVADGQTLTDGDEITIHIAKSYYWKNIQVQPDNFIVDILPNANMENGGRVVFLAGSDMIVPLEGYTIGKWYRCEYIYNEETGDGYYDWVLVPNQISLPMVTEMETDANKVITGQCFDYVGDDSVEYSNGLQTIVLRKGHVYRAVVKYPDDPDFATVCYYDVYPYQFDAMPAGEEEYNEVVAQYTGTDESTYTQGHFYRCVPTGEMTAPSSMSRPSEEGFSFEIDADVLETQVDDPTQPFTFEFQSQGAGFQWLVRTGPNVWTTCELSWYGITVVGEAPYGAQVKVKYVEPQPEYIWQEVPISGDSIQYEEMPMATESDVGRIIQYIGETTDEFVNGYFYQAVTEMVPSGLNYYTSSSAFTVTLDKDQFESYVEPTGDMDLVFTYDSSQSTWLLQGGDLPVAVDIADYGVTITGTPNNDDRLELFYSAEYPDYWWEEKDVQNNSQTEYLGDITPLDVGKIRQYTGETTQDYTNGYFYKAHIGLNQTSGSTTNPLSIVDEEIFAGQVYGVEISSSAEVKGVRFEVRSGLNTQWVLYFFDENGNEIGATTTNPNLADFEQTFGLSIGGTVTTSTTAEANLTFDWERIDVQPSSGGGVVITYDAVNEALTIS